jgi:hypothetical protein
VDDDYNLILFLSSAGPCSLNKSPKKNWVERGGGLPNYICHIAKAVSRSGHSTSSAIAIAIGTVRKWAAGGDKVNASTRAKAARALAQWEALKAKAHAGHLVKASNGYGEDYVTLGAAGVYNMDAVREAWDRLQTVEQAHKANQSVPKNATVEYDTEAAPKSWSFVREVWSNFIIVAVNGPEDNDTYKVPYTVADDGDIEFGVPKRVVQAWEEQADDDLTDDELEMLEEILKTQNPDDEVKLSAPIGPRKVRSLEGQRRFKAPIGATIVDKPGEDGGAPSTVVRLISLWRQYKQAKDAGDTDTAQSLMHTLNKALDAFPATKDNKAQLAKIRKLVNP